MTTKQRQAAMELAFNILKPLVPTGEATNARIRQEIEKACDQVSPKGWRDLDVNVIMLALL